MSDVRTEGHVPAYSLSLPMEEIARFATDAFQEGGSLVLTVKGGSMMPFLRPLKDRVVLVSIGFSE